MNADPGLGVGLGSSAPFRYDPNDLSVGDDEESGSPRSAIKNLNFSKIARASDSDLGMGSASLSRDSGSGSATSTTTKNGSASAFSPDWMREAAAAGEGESEGGEMYVSVSYLHEFWLLR